MVDANKFVPTEGGLAKALAPEIEAGRQAESLRARLDFVMRLYRGKLTYEEYRSLKKDMKQQYRRTFGAPKSPSERRAEQVNAEKKKRRAKLAKQSKKNRRRARGR
jgi:hypothetical protein